MVYNYYTDGAASMKKINGEYLREAGGWAFALVTENNKLSYEDYGRENETTNNRMELMAILQSLAHYYAIYNSKEKNNIINIYSDSAYCVNIYTNWIKAWESNGWRRGKKKEPIENVELIKSTWELIKKIEKNSNSVNFIKVKGHSNNNWNNYVDELAIKIKTGKIDDEGGHLYECCNLI